MERSKREKRADFSIWNDRYEILTTIVGGETVFGAHHLASTRATSVG